MGKYITFFITNNKIKAFIVVSAIKNMRNPSVSFSQRIIMREIGINFTFHTNSTHWLFLLNQRAGVSPNALIYSSPILQKIPDCS